jgi:cytochrome c oxidase subunit 2
MWSWLGIPEQASSVAARVDALYLFLVTLSLVFGLGIAAALVFFAVRYRRRSADERPALIEGSLALELTWTIVPLLIVTVIFFWSASLFFTIERVPPDAMEIYVVGKRWMWKAQHMTGQREINQLHVPVGRNVRLTMTSEDVIHSFFVPAFRVKKDVLPGRYTTAWFQATKTGRFHLFCAEYCGTKHSGMIGSVVAMEPQEFQAWLAGGGAAESPVAAGEKLFNDLACNTCHMDESQGLGPSLNDIYGKPVQLQSGSTVIADDAYIRESIVNPQAQIVAGYQPIMPTFQGLVSEEQLLQLIAYVRSLSQQPAAPAGTTAPTMPQASDRPVIEKK